MLVEYYCEGKKKSVEIDNNKTKAKERKNEFILYTYLEKSPVENKDGEKMIAPSARDFYMTSMESFFKEAKEQGLITSQETINPFNIGNVEFLNDILYNLQKDDKYKVVATNKRRNRTTSFRHLLDFVKNFEVPQIYLFNIKPSDDYWKKYPPEKWQLGINGNKIAYGESANIKKGDIALFKITGDIKAIRHIGRVYDIKKGTVYFEILARLKNDLTLTEMREVAGIENFHQNKLGKISEQQAALQLTIECFKQAEKQEQEMPNNSRENSSKNPPLNQILYGPPGTGKTYSTINKALEILGYGMQDNEKSKITLDYDRIKQKLQEIAKSEYTKALNLENLDYKSERELAKLLFDYYRQNEQIEFITFHQSFSYEEFVEGIKPIFVDENGNEVEHSKNMIYKHKRGVFKKICETALQDLRDIQNRIKSNPYVWKVSLEDAGGELHQYCLKNNEIRIGFQHDGGDKNPSVKYFKDEMQKGDIVGIFNDKQSFNAVGVIIGNCDGQNIDKKAKITENYPITRKVKWIIKDCIIENIDNQGKQLDRNTIYQLKFRVNDLFEKIQDKVGYNFNDLPNKITCRDLPTKPYILIIDEINRGNISKILGELITLIEPSKRIGADEELRVSLPYSANEFDGGKGFGVPKNLYIIGTMNTADRSIALLDTALRRRFEFVEMMSQPELLEIIKVENGEINLQMLLEKMNARIEFLLDREHTIGHSFFINVNSLSELQQVFKNKIIPLLQEYFYDDYAKIDAVLNGNGMVTTKKDKNGKKVDIAQLFEKFTNEDFISNNEKKIYEIEKEWKKWEVWQFIQIYNSNEADKLKSQSKNFSQLNNNE